LVRASSGSYVVIGPLTTTAIDDNENWNHIIITWDHTLANTNLKLYRNGGTTPYATVNKDATAPTGASQSAPTLFASGGGGEDFTGIIDDFRIYNKVLSETERLAIYNAGTGTQTNQFATGDHTMTLVGRSSNLLAPVSETRILSLLGNTTNGANRIRTYASNDGGSVWDEASMVYQGAFGGKTNTFRYDGWTNFTATGATKTNLAWKVFVTNGATEVRIEGISLLGR